MTFVAGATAGLIIGCLRMLNLSRKRLASLQIDAEGRIRAAENPIAERVGGSEELQKALGSIMDSTLLWYPPAQLSTDTGSAKVPPICVDIRQ
jgi:hypothetical protein